MQSSIKLISSLIEEITGTPVCFISSSTSIPDDYSKELDLSSLFSKINFQRIEKRSPTYSFSYGLTPSTLLKIAPFSIETLSFTWQPIPSDSSQSKFLSHNPTSRQASPPKKTLQPIPHLGSFMKDQHQSGSAGYWYVAMIAVVGVLVLRVWRGRARGKSHRE